MTHNMIGASKEKKFVKKSGWKLSSVIYKSFFEWGNVSLREN